MLQPESSGRQILQLPDVPHRPGAPLRKAKALQPRAGEEVEVEVVLRVTQQQTRKRGAANTSDFAAGRRRRPVGIGHGGNGRGETLRIKRRAPAFLDCCAGPANKLSTVPRGGGEQVVDGERGSAFGIAARMIAPEKRE